MTGEIMDDEQSDNQPTNIPAKAAMTEGIIARQAQEVQAAIIIAKRFPRDETASMARIMTACKRKALAEVSQYEYSRGGTKIDGPSIRLAEAIAGAWGNIQFGIDELEQTNGVSTVMAYAWDLETNTREAKVFSVKHWRDTKGGGYALKDQRDIYELVANLGARRMRACILGVIPGDVVDAAIDACNQTLLSKNGEPLIDTIRKVVVAFADLGVTQDMIEKRLQHKMDATSHIEVARLRKIYASIKDGMGKREDFFEVGSAGKAEEKLGKKPPTEPEQKKQQPTESEKKPEPEKPEPLPIEVDEWLGRFRRDLADAKSTKRMNELGTSLNEERMGLGEALYQRVLTEEFQPRFRDIEAGEKGGKGKRQERSTAV